MVSQLSIDLASPAASNPHQAPEAPKTENIAAIATLVLRQIRYWFGKQGGLDDNSGHWVYKAARELVDELAEFYNVKTSIPTVQRALRKLVRLGLLKREKKWSRYWNQTWFYQITEATERFFGSFKPRQKRPKTQSQPQNQSNESPRNNGLVTLEQCIQRIQQRTRSKTALGFGKQQKSGVNQQKIAGALGQFTVIDDDLWPLSLT